MNAAEKKEHTAPEPYVLILFSIHYVLKAEKLLKNSGISHDVVPVPREISSDCGMAILFAPESFARVRDILAAAQIAIARIHRKGRDGLYQEIAWKDK
ncbi:DUF3343 domain-containing protein [Thiovibrio sp. JS02]